MKKLYLVGIVLLSLMVVSCSAPPSESPSPSSNIPSSTSPSISPTPATYSVLLKSDPSGAHIWLNGNDTGSKTPYSFTAEPGEHTVVLKLEGYQNLQDRIRVVDKNVIRMEDLLLILETPEEYKAKAQTIEYRVLEKTPDKYKGMVLTYTGHVVQIMEDAGVTFMRVEVTQGEYGTWSDVIGVIYMGSLDIFDDDIVTFWGPGSGTYEYESQAGWKISIPSVLAKYVEK